jgi:hypothetical protein
MTMSSQDRVSQKANPDTKIKDPGYPRPKGAKEGFQPTGIYKVVNTFTDSKGRRWQTDNDFPNDDDAELKMQLDKGNIRADGEPQEYVGAHPSGEVYDPKQRNERHDKPAQQNEQPRSNPR